MMARTLKATVLALALLGVPAAQATYPVIDAEAVARMREQLGKLQEQIDAIKKQTEWMTTMSGQLQDQIDAIGAMGQISLPHLSLDSLANDLARSAQCLTPNLDQLMPGLHADDLHFGSICGGRQVYEKALWFDPDKVGNNDGDGVTWASQAKARRAVMARREALTKRIAAEGLAAGDLGATNQAKKNEQAVQELKAAADAAKTQNDRLAAIAQGQVLTNRQLGQQNQLLAQLVRIQSAMLVGMGIPVNEAPSTSDDTEEDE